MNVEHGSRDKWGMKSIRELREMMQEAGMVDKLKPFNDIIFERRPPAGGYGDKPVLAEQVIDGRVCDIYHTDQKPGDSGHRVFIHVKE